MTKNAVMVTGAASGIGYACVRNLLRDGVSVVAALCNQGEAAFVEVETAARDGEAQGDDHRSVPWTQKRGKKQKKVRKPG